MTTIPETPGTAPSSEHPAQQRAVTRKLAEGRVDQVRPDKVQKGLQTAPSAPVRERHILRQDSETKPIPNVPPTPPGMGDPYEPSYEPPDELSEEVAAGARQYPRTSTRPRRPS